METLEHPRTGLRFVREADPENPAISESEERSDGMTKFAGYLLRWDDVAHIRDLFGSYNENFAPGAFLKTFNERGPNGNRAIKMLRNHDQKQAQVGKWLNLGEDAKGAYFEAETVPTGAGRDVAIEIREGILNTMSIGFDDLSKDNYDKERNLFTVREAKMYEASPVYWPAYESATIDQVRSLEQLVPLLGRFMSVMESGETLSDEQIGQLTQIRSRITSLLDRPAEESPDETTESVAPVDDHANEVLARFRLLNLG